MNEAQAASVVLVPTGLMFQHGFQGLQSKRVARVVESNRHSSSIGMDVTLMASYLTAQEEAVLAQSPNDLTCCDRTELTVISRGIPWFLNRNCDSGL